MTLRGVTCSFERCTNELTDSAISKHRHKHTRAHKKVQSTNLLNRVLHVMFRYVEPEAVRQRSGSVWTLGSAKAAVERSESSSDEVIIPSEGNETYAAASLQGQERNLAPRFCPTAAKREETVENAASDRCLSAESQHRESPNAERNLLFPCSDMIELR